MQKIKVTFLPLNKSVFVLHGITLLEAAGHAGIALQTPCGGSGICGKCKAIIIDGVCHPTVTERITLGNDLVEKGYRLLCQARATDELTVDIPFESLFENEFKMQVSGEEVEVALNPAVQKIYFELTPPDQYSPECDLARLRGHLGNVAVPYTLLMHIPSFLRKNSWKGTAVIYDQNLAALEEGDTQNANYGIAVDIGTTTIAAVLIDLVKKKDIAFASCINPQITFGDDVISRIQYIREHTKGLYELQAAVQKSTNGLVSQLVYRESILPSAVYEMVVAGNTTMQQIFCGFDPSALGERPFVPVFDTFQRAHAVELGVGINPGADILVYGQIGCFVGGDTLAGMAATRIDACDKPALLIDIGTNGEVVLSTDTAMYAVSTAAGPAFEGARIGQGMRATSGAIEEVFIGETVNCGVVGNISPVGICGTGLIDAVAHMLDLGIIDMSGRILRPDEIRPDLPPKVKERLVINKNGLVDFMLALPIESGNGKAVMLSQKDIRELQLASGAIRAGINVLLKRCGIIPQELATVFLAGAFGNFIRTSSAMRIGLLPQMAPEKIKQVGNTALRGAKMALLSLKERAYAEELRRKTVHVDLSLEPEFQMEFGMAMMFPEKESVMSALM